MTLPLFSERDLAVMRAELLSTYRSTCTLERPGAFVDEGGGSGYYAPGTSDTFSCRTNAVSSGDETLLAEQPAIIELVRISYSLDAPAMVATDRPLVDGVRYEVVGVQPLDTHAVERHVTLRRANG